MRRTKRWIGIGLVTTLAGLGLELMTPTTVSAARATLSCQGITGDNASSLGDSRATLAAISTTGLTIDVDITPTVPAKVRPGGGAFDVAFGINLTLPATVVSAARTTLGLSSLTVSNTTFAVNATGAANTSITKLVPSRVVDLTAPVVQVNETITGKVTPTTAGNIVFRPGNTQMTIDINKSVGPATIRSITIVCSSNAAIGTTAVAVPGSPNIGGNFEGGIWGGGYAGGLAGVKLLDTGLITPDDGNPIVPDSLAINGALPAGTGAGVAGGALFFTASQPGAYSVPLRVCGASRMTQFVPGVNEVQTLTWGEDHRIKKDLNALPIAVTFKWGDKETQPVPLAQAFGQALAPKPGFELFFADFAAPSAGAVQTALEGIMGAGNIKVSGGGNNGPYEFTFAGALGKKDQPQIEIGQWITWLPADLLTSALAAINPPAPAPGETTTTTTTPLTDDQLDARLTQEIQDAINTSQPWDPAIKRWFDGRVANLVDRIVKGVTSPESTQKITSLLPKKPAVGTKTEGVTEEPSVPTGPLCSSFDANFIIAPQPVVVAGKVTVRRCSRVRVKVSKNRYRTKTVCRTVTIKK